MAQCACSLKQEDYTVKNALLWGNFLGHCKKVKKSDFCGRIVHIIIASLEVIPVVGQIISLFEMFIAKLCMENRITKDNTDSPRSSEKQDVSLLPVPSLAKRSNTGNSTPPIVISSQEGVERHEPAPKEQVIRLKIEVINKNDQIVQIPTPEINRPASMGQQPDAVIRSESIVSPIIRKFSQDREMDRKEKSASKENLSIQAILVGPKEVILDNTPLVRGSMILSQGSSIVSQKTTGQEGIPSRSKSAPAKLSQTVREKTESEGSDASQEETQEMTSSFVSVSEDGIEGHPGNTEKEKEINEKQKEKEKENA